MVASRSEPSSVNSDDARSRWVGDAGVGTGVRSSAPTAAEGTRAESPPIRNAGRSGIFKVYPSLAVPSFRLMWLGMLPATLAWQMSVVTVGYAALILSDSATAIGLVSSATGVSMLLLSLVGGVAADRFPRRTVLLWMQGLLGAVTAVLAVLTLAGLLKVWHLGLLALVQGVAFSFNMPARQAYMAELVGPRLLRNAMALNNAGINFCRVVGPGVAGVLLALPWFGVGGVFVVMIGMYLVVMLTLFRLPGPVPKPAAASGRPAANGWDQLLEGLRYIRSSPTLLALLGLALLTLSFAMPLITLLPVFSERVYGVGAAGLGVLMGANGAGALIGSLTVAALATHRRPGALQIGFGLGYGLSIIGFALAPSFVVAVVLVGLVGFTSGVYTGLNGTLVMGNAEPRLYGRVMSVYLMTFAVTPLAALPMAWLADQIGAPITILGAGVIVVALVGGTAILYPPYRRIR